MSRAHSPRRRLFWGAFAIFAILSGALFAAALQQRTGTLCTMQWVIWAASIVLALLALVVLMVLLHSGKNEESQEKSRWILTDILKEPQYSGRTQQKLESEMLKTQAQINSLQSQINPHFLYNTLESIRSKALVQGEEEIAMMVETLARLFRYNISRKSAESSIADELENVKNYIRIQNYRFRDKFTLTLNLKDLEDLVDSYQMPTLTLQPIVENAIHHGLEPKLSHGTVEIRGFQTQSKIIIQVRDDGIGMKPEKVQALMNRITCPETDAPKEDAPSRGSGVALRNVHQRLQLYYGTEYGLRVISSEHIGTQVEISMPRKSNKRGNDHAEGTV